MAAAKAADVWGQLPGRAQQTSDAESAYVQSNFGGDPCYVRLPKDWRPPSWRKTKGPARRFVKVCTNLLAQEVAGVSVRAKSSQGKELMPFLIGLRVSIAKR